MSSPEQTPDPGTPLTVEMLHEVVETMGQRLYRTGQFNHTFTVEDMMLRRIGGLLIQTAQVIKDVGNIP